LTVRRAGTALGERAPAGQGDGTVRINPRQHVLEAWRALAQVTVEGHSWSWGGRHAPNSISDARQLLCLLRPAAELPGFRLGEPDRLDDDVLVALGPMGNAPYIPRLLLEALAAYLDRYSREDGTPAFTAGPHLSCVEPGDPIKAEQAEYDLTESFSVSITLCVTAKWFLAEYARSIVGSELRQRVERVHQGIDRRLTAAMVGLLRSFVVAVPDPDSAAEDRLLALAGQGRAAGRTLLRDLNREFQLIGDKLAELTLGLSPESGQGLLSDPERVFECGWTWGVAHGAGPVVPFLDEVPQDGGIAEPRPLLHFTVGALEALTVLLSDRTFRLGLLDSRQLMLREALNLRWGLTVRYWSALATFGVRWPVEDVPWETSEGHSSPYYSALVMSIVALEQAANGGVRDGGSDFAARCESVLAELAQRGLVTRRARADDPGLALHSPGVAMPLPGSERLGPPLVWVHDRYPITLARTALRFAGLPSAVRVRPQLTDLAERIIAHLLARRDQSGGLWDSPGGVFPGLAAPAAEPDWDFTEDALEVFVAAARLITTPLPFDLELAQRAGRTVTEAWHALAQEQLTTPITGGSQVQRLLHALELRLNRAESLLAARPATAAALADRVLLELDELASARLDAFRSR
jgi:hypothetical protein